jgi:hypothetical protein
MPVIPATWEVEIGRISVCGQPGQLLKSHLNKQAEHGDVHYNPSSTRGVGRRVVVCGKKNQTLSEK